MDKIRVKTIEDPKHTVYTPNEEEMKQWKAVMAQATADWNKDNENWDKLLKGYTEGLAKAGTLK